MNIMHYQLFKKNKNYRADIDGLRTIAVFLVILFHANVNLLEGGYIGVDVFFVISGYLITKSINKEMIEKTFSFKQFYLRRIRRIIPVLVFVIIVVTIPAYLILFANHFEGFSRSALHTFLSTNNFYLWINNSQYFVENSEFQPLLHTWSLSVEEQFYILWPILLFFFHKKFSSKIRLKIVSSIIVFGLILSIYLAREVPNMAYFLLPARIFELLIGAGLAIYWEKLPKFSKIVTHVISIIGFALIIIPSIVLNNTSYFPGLNAFWPCLGTALLIFSGKNENIGIVNTVLKNKILVGIGLLSYSAYLWHWPLFVFIKYLGIELDGIIRVAAIIATLILSYFSWYFVEEPFRHKYKFNFKKTIAVIMLPSALMIAAIYGIVDYKDGFPNRFYKLIEFNKEVNGPDKVRENCFDKFKVGNCEECFIGHKKDTLDGLLIGDSYANHTAAFLDVLAKNAHLYIHDTAAGGYPLLNDIDENGKDIFPKKYAKKRLKYAKKFKNIFIAANWTNLSDKKSKNYKRVMDAIEELVNLKKTIVIFDALRATDDITLHKAKLIKTGKYPYLNEEDLFIPFKERPKDYIVNEIKARFKDVIVIDLNDAMCENGRCSLKINNTIVFRDRDHLNTSGAKLMGERYLKLKGNPLQGL